jgi:hypothetical protein
MKKICKNCTHWQNGHEGYWEPEHFGNCQVLDREIEVPKFSLALGLVEGCVSVEDRCNTFEFITCENFGCVHFKVGKTK